jgi:hypothetical protein
LIHSIKEYDFGFRLERKINGKGFFQEFGAENT